MRRNEDSLRDLWDIMCTNICITRVPSEEKSQNRLEKIFEEIIAENLPKMREEIVNQVQEASTKGPREDKLREKHTEIHSNENDKN